MRYALVNPSWSFKGSIYSGCREPHLPLEYGYAKHRLERAGHLVTIVDGQLDDLGRGEIVSRVGAFRPDFIVVTTAPSYLSWRSPPPELRIPQQTVRDLKGLESILVGIGPHGSITPRTALAKLGVDVVVMGEAEEILPLLAGEARGEWRDVPSICFRQNGNIRIHDGPHLSDMTVLPALTWPERMTLRHQHHHHRFDVPPWGPGAEMEASRGWHWNSGVCTKDQLRIEQRQRPLATILAELDGLIAQGVEYVYFIDDVFLPNTELLQALEAREVIFGIHTRIDLWSAGMLDCLGRAGCVSMKAGIEKIVSEGHRMVDKESNLATDDLLERLIYAKKSIPFVQAHILDAGTEDPLVIDAWRRHLQRYGVWANAPVPRFVYPGSVDYLRKWGPPDDRAWERAYTHYLREYAEFSDLQDTQPLPLQRLEWPVQECHDQTVGR